MIYQSARFLVVAFAVAALACGSAATAQDRPPVKVGIIFTFSGSGGPIGKTFTSAVTAFQKTFGDSAGGRKIQLILRDDGGPAPEVARRLANELITGENVNALAGVVFSPNAVAVGQVSTQAKIPFFISNASTTGIIAANPYTARFSFTEAQIVTPLAQWALKNGIKTAYGVYYDYGPGQEANAAFAQAFTAGGGKMLGTLAVPLSNKDFSPYIQRLRDAKPDAVMTFVGAFGSGVPFMRAFTDSGLGKGGMRVLAGSDLSAETNFPALGDMAIGVISSNNYTPDRDTPQNRQFVREFRAASGGDTPDFIAVAAYDTLAAIYKLVEVQHGALDPDKTMELVKTLKFESPRGPVEIDPATRDLVQNIYITRTERKDGKLTNALIATYPRVKDPFEK